ncbi:MAG: FmdB family zinc ribbon protein [bacterium]
MPYYDYICDDCEEAFEVFFSINDNRDGVKCSGCGSKNVRRNFGSVYLPKKSGGGGTGGGGGSCSTCSSTSCSSCH